MLPDAAIETQLEREVLRVGNLVCGHEKGAHGSEAIEPLPMLPVEKLVPLPRHAVLRYFEAAFGPVVHDRITVNVAESLVHWDVLSRPSDHRRQLYFPVDRLA